METIFNKGSEVSYEEKVIKVRRLGVIDVFTFAKLLGKVGSGSFSRLASQVRLLDQQASSEGLTEEERNEAELAKSRNAQQLGFEMFSTLAEHQEELLAFLASLTDVPDKEFNFLPPDVVIEIVEKVATGDDIKRFFDKARALASKVLPQQQ